MAGARQPLDGAERVDERAKPAHGSDLGAAGDREPAGCHRRPQRGRECQAQNALSALKNAGYARSGIGLGLTGARSHFFNLNGAPKTAGATP